jgi:hypothetical protein
MDRNSWDKVKLSNRLTSYAIVQHRYLIRHIGNTDDRKGLIFCSKNDKKETTKFCFMTWSIRFSISFMKFVSDEDELNIGLVTVMRCSEVGHPYI